MEPETVYVTARPAPALRPFIERYAGYRLRGHEPGIHRGLPSRNLTFIASIGPTIDVVGHTDPSQSPGSFRFVCSGLQATPALISHTGDQEGVAIELTPLGARALLRRPASALWNTSVEAADVAGGAGDELWERLQAVVGWRDRFAACDGVLLRLLEPDRVVATELTYAWRALVGSGGNASVVAVAGEIGWTRQHLTRRFRDEFGCTPKTAARVVRFERARRMLVSTPSYVTIAQVAATCGYFDHADLDRDFAEFAGCSPSEWLATEVPLMQDDDLHEG